MIDIFDIYDAGMDNEKTSILTDLKIPSTYYKNNNAAYRYWFRSLLHKIDSSLKFYDLPDGWSNDFFMFCLWARGYVAVFRSNRKDLEKYGSGGVLFQPVTISGYDFYYQPTTAAVCNPKYEKMFDIGSDCYLLKLTPDFRGVLDIIDFYSAKLAEISKSIDMGLLNAKMPVILTTTNEAQAATLKAAYDKIQSGSSLLVWDDTNDSDEIIPRKDPFEFWSQNFKETYIVHDLLEDMKTILDSFYNEIGLPVAIDKKERLITSETEFATAQSQARISCWYETLMESLEIINDKFNLNITVEIKANEVNENASQNDIDRDGE